MGDGWEGDYSIHDSNGGQIAYLLVMIIQQVPSARQCQLESGFTSKSKARTAGVMMDSITYNANQPR